MTKQEKIKFKELKRQNEELLTIIRLRCCDCLNFFDGGYQKCTDLVCPLLPYFPTKGQLKKKDFMARSRELKKSREDQS